MILYHTYGYSTEIQAMTAEIEMADDFVKSTAINKLQVIADQIRYLQEQAKKVLENAQRDNNLHHAACNFKKVPGRVYHLYQRPSGQKYFSILSPSEWGVTCPHEYLGSYRLEHDMSWTPEAKMRERTQELDVLNKIFTSHKALTNTPVWNIQPQLGPQAIDAHADDQGDS